MSGKNTIISNSSIPVPVSPKDYGRERANVAASVEDYCQYQKGSCEALEAGEGLACEDVITIASADTKSLKGFIFQRQDGSTHTILMFEPQGGVGSENFHLPVEIPLIPANQSRLDAAINLAVRFMEISPTFIKIDLDGDDNTATINHIGASALTEVIFATGANESTTRLCTLGELSEYALGVEGALGDLINDASSAAMPNNPYTFTVGDPAANELIRAQLEADYVTLLPTVGVTAKSVKVTVDNENEEYDVLIVAVSEIPLEQGAGNPFDIQRTFQGFLPL